jgi:protein-tyrosine phosphatase
MTANFSRITGRVFCGGQINDSADVNELVAAGVTHIIDAQVERDDAPLMTSGLHYLWVPTADDGVHPKPVEWFSRAIEFAMPALGVPGGVVFTHCAAGVNRGPSLAYAIMRAQGWSAADAMAQLKAKRPIAQAAYADDAELALRSLGWVTSD